VIESWNMHLYSYAYKCSCRLFMLCLQHDFYNIIFKIKHKLYTPSGSAPPPPKKEIWMCPCSRICCLHLSGRRISYGHHVCRKPHSVSPQTNTIFTYRLQNVRYHHLISTQLLCGPWALRPRTPRTLKDI
jgi:hypothetical protein